MTEASHQVLSNPLSEASRSPCSVGVPQGDIEVKVLNPQDRPVASDSEGEVCIRGPSAMAG